MPVYTIQALHQKSHSLGVGLLLATPCICNYNLHITITNNRFINPIHWTRNGTALGRENGLGFGSPVMTNSTGEARGDPLSFTLVNIEHE